MVVVFAHFLDKVSGSVIFWLFLFGEPFAAQAVCDTGKYSVQAQGLIVSESAAVVVP